MWLQSSIILCKFARILKRQPIEHTRQVKPGVILAKRLFLKLASSFAVSGIGAGSLSASESKPHRKSEAAAFAILNHPGCISAFTARPVERKDDVEIIARFQLACKMCLSSNLRILCFPITVAEAGKYAGMDVGDIIERNPHHVICVSCGERHLVFDATTHGYDGVLEHGSTYEQGNGEEKPIVCNAESYQVDVVFTYNIDFVELQDIANEEKLQPQDLFDWFHIIAMAPDGTELKDINYECA